MPCGDITEVIDLSLDHDDRLVRYELTKRTCGAEIGTASLLAELVVGKDIPTILELHGDDILEAYDAADVEEFLYFKHLVALQEALSVLRGDTAGAISQPCTAVSIAADADGVSFVGHIAVDLMAERIRSCGNCGSCGSRRRSTIL